MNIHIYRFIYLLIYLTRFYTYRYDCLDVQLTFNKHGALEAPPNHYPIDVVKKQ